VLRVRYTLVADGPSDRALTHVIDWAIREAAAGEDCEVAARFADTESGPGELAERMRRAVKAFPCDVLFVHRDAERMARDVRCEEVRQAAEAARVPSPVAVVPVRMTEAWLLLDANAIARAADRVGELELELPPVSRLDRVPDPKTVLHQLLRDASGKSGRHQRRFARDIGNRVQRVAEYIGTFAPLRALPAFQEFEAETAHALRRLPRS
jgi:hypothetical protein